MFVRVIATVLAALVLAPTVHAEEAYNRSWQFTDDPHPTLTGDVYLLGPRTVPTGLPNPVDADPVALDAGTPVVWADQTALAAAAPFSDGDVDYDLFFEKASTTTTPITVTVAFGYVDDAGFHALATAADVPVQRFARQVGSVPASNEKTDIGRARGTISAITGTVPAGAFAAISIVSDADNDLHTRPTMIGARVSTASATIPLPEPATLVLMGVGFAAVAGVAIYRRR